MDDPVVERILAAALAEFERVGIRRAVMGRIADDAGIGRATLYRRFPDKAGLVQAALQHRVAVSLALLEQVMAADPDPVARLVGGFVETVELVRHDPLLQRVLATEPEAVLPVATVNGGLALGLARDFVADQLAALELPSGADLDVVAEIVVRLVHSLMLTPDGVLARDRAGARELAERYLAPAVLAMTGQSSSAG